MAAFEGFPDDFLVFFRELKTNNNRAWRRLRDARAMRERGGLRGDL